MMRLLVVMLASASLTPIAMSEAGLLFRRDGSPRTPLRTVASAARNVVARRAEARASRGAFALFPRVRSAALGGGGASAADCSSCAAPQNSVDCSECVVAEGIAAAANTRRDRLDGGMFQVVSQLLRRNDLTANQRGELRRLLLDRELRAHVGRALGERYGVGDGTLLQILQVILQNREDVQELIRFILEIVSLF